MKRDIIAGLAIFVGVGSLAWCAVSLDRIANAPCVAVEAML